MNFEDVWRNIERHAGETFHTIRGRPLKYVVIGNQVVTDRTVYQLARSNFEKAWLMKSVSGPGDLSNHVRGPSYVWAILNDDRIRSAAV